MSKSQGINLEQYVSIEQLPCVGVSGSGNNLYMQSNLLYLKQALVHYFEHRC